MSKGYTQVTDKNEDKEFPNENESWGAADQSDREDMSSERPVPQFQYLFSH